MLFSVSLRLEHSSTSMIFRACRKSPLLLSVKFVQNGMRYRWMLDHPNMPWQLEIFIHTVSLFYHALNFPMLDLKETIRR